MKARHAAVVAGLALGLMSGTAKASVTVQFSQVGDNVAVTATGSLNISGLSDQGVSDSGGTFVYPNGGNFNLQSGSGETYFGVSTSSFGTGYFSSPNTTSGDVFGLEYGGALYLPAGYQSGQNIISSDLFLDSSFSSLGLTPGKYVASWSSDSIVIDIPALSTVPLPSSAPMFGAALMALGAVGYGLKRKSKAAGQA